MADCPLSFFLEGKTEYPNSQLYPFNIFNILKPFLSISTAEDVRSPFLTKKKTKYLFLQFSFFPIFLKSSTNFGNIYFFLCVTKKQQKRLNNSQSMTFGKFIKFPPTHKTDFFCIVMCVEMYNM
jgi:hypothetical protein